MTCTHPWDDLRISITGVRCAACNASDTGFDALFFDSIQRKIASMDARFDQMERAVSRAGLVCCERCGEWYQPTDRSVFILKDKDGSLVLCPGCVMFTLNDEDDTDRFVGPDGDWKPDLGRRLVHWAFALPKSEYAARIAVETTFPSEVRRIRAQ